MSASSFSPFPQVFALPSPLPLLSFPTFYCIVVAATFITFSRCSQVNEGILVDCRNAYEFEVGRFDGAKKLPIHRHIDAFSALEDALKGYEDKVSLDLTMLFVLGETVLT